MLAAAAETYPLVILVDGFQWIDLESKRILLFIARRVSDEPIAMIIAAWDGPGWPAVTGGLPVIRLAGLSYDDCARLARKRHVPIAPDSLRSLVERTGGNPLAVLENLSSAADSGGCPEDGQLVLHSSLHRAWSQVLDQRPAATQRARSWWRRGTVTASRACRVFPAPDAPASSNPRHWASPRACSMTESSSRRPISGQLATVARAPPLRHETAPPAGQPRRLRQHPARYDQDVPSGRARASGISLYQVRDGPM